jgi:hypothetical protein
VADDRRDAAAPAQIDNGPERLEQTGHDDGVHPCEMSRPNAVLRTSTPIAGHQVLLGAEAGTRAAVLPGRRRRGRYAPSIRRVLGSAGPGCSIGLAVTL